MLKSPWPDHLPFPQDSEVERLRALLRRTLIILRTNAADPPGLQLAADIEAMIGRVDRRRPP